jgi:CHAT domain-containing protein
MLRRLPVFVLIADWVVLSACNTASSDGAGAEALSGLARAFFYAGAKSLLVSHWQVSDVATPQLMASVFGAAQHSNLSHAELLQRAQIQMLDNATSASAAHPRNWGPFVVVGEPAKGS